MTSRGHVARRRRALTHSNHSLTRSQDPTILNPSRKESFETYNVCQVIVLSNDLATNTLGYLLLAVEFTILFIDTSFKKWGLDSSPSGCHAQ